MADVSNDEVDSEDEWYARMEAAAAGTDDPEDEITQPLPLTSRNTSTITDEQYYNSIQEYNCDAVPDGFSSESDPIWHSMLKMTAKSTVTVPEKGELIHVKASDAASIMLAQQWAFGYLPKSSKVFMLLGIAGEATDGDYSVYTDDVLHSTLVVVVATKKAWGRIEVSVFSPYTTTETAFPSMFRTIERIQKTSGVADVVFCGAEYTHYQQFLAREACWCEQWTEVCGMYVYESHLPPPGEDNNAGGYIVDDLRESDAEIINDAWKYKTSASIILVKKMIALGQCRGIRYRNNGSINADDNAELLVSWFLTYPDGSLGMLYTHQDHRGKGLARRVVLAVLRKVLTPAPDQDARKCAPYVFIECSNDASMALFQSLGFAKIQEAVWAGLKHEP